MSSSSIPVRMPCSVPGKACYVVWKNQFLIDDRYQPLRALGRGAYGMVMSARDAVTGDKVAIKKINAVFENPIVAWRTLREVRGTQLQINSCMCVTWHQGEMRHASCGRRGEQQDADCEKYAQ